MFNVGRSMFDVHLFLFFDQTGCPLAGLRRAQPNRGRRSYETSGNDECRMTIDEWWNRFRLGASLFELRSPTSPSAWGLTLRATTPQDDPKRRSVFLKWTVRQKTHDRQNTLNPKSAFQNPKFGF